MIQVHWYQLVLVKHQLIRSDGLLVYLVFILLYTCITVYSSEKFGSGKLVCYYWTTTDE